MGDSAFDLEDLGWDASFRSALDALALENCAPARVMLQEKELYIVRDAAREFAAEVSGRLRHAAGGPQDFPAVGDWVAVRPAQGDGRAAIHAVLPRRSKFSRRAAGERTEEQVVAANVDVVFLVSGLDGDYNPRRIERYVTAAWESGALPVVLLNKADLCEDPAGCALEVETVAAGVAVHALSALTREGVGVVRTYLQRGKTAALLGSSGVGKSSLINALLGDTIQRVEAVREGDSRGRHTTTRRQLFLLAGGGLLLDTPGMRELQLWDGAAGVEAAFEEIAALAASCRFRDCRHAGEPGCAVLRAVDEGTLSSERLASYHKLEREIRHQESRRDAALRSAENKRLRALFRSYNKIQRKNRRRKG